MKISRPVPLRRRRSHLPTLLILVLLILAGVLGLAWVRGGQQPRQPIAIAVPTEALGR
jgi:hypothetical protein